MTQGFYKIKVHHLVKETEDATSIFFDIPAELKETFSYKPGQYVTIKANIDGQDVRRAYSHSTSPLTDSIPAVTVKKVDNGWMSVYLNDVLKEGDELELMPPNGKFIVDIDANKKQHYVLFGGGSGITPLMSIAKSVLLSEPNSSITLIYANRDSKSVIFKSALEKIEKEHKDRFKMYYSFDNAPFGWFGLKGYLTEEKVQKVVKERVGGMWQEHQYYICGPVPMMDIVKKGLASSSIAAEHIHSEYFSAPVSNESKKGVEVAAETEVKFNGTATAKITVYGKTHTITVPEGKTILKAAIDAGLEPPFSCTVGVCTTCRAKLSKGKVHMNEREGLSDDELNDNYILTCQSLARSSELEMVFE